ncbi:MAG: hypothetical protein R3284_10750 [Rubricoccaceae bacterium]|nr:hypothetical protein [Rubricoccaceae bacterium]
MNLHTIRTLATAQLKLDLRHPQSGRFSASRIATTLLAYGFSGLVLALSLWHADAESMLFVSASFGMVLAAFGVTGSYDELMGRPKDNAWLSTLPASESTQYAARLVSIGFYFIITAVAVATPVGLRTAFSSGIGEGLSVFGLVTGGMLWTASVTTTVLWVLTLALPYKILYPSLNITKGVLIAMLVLGYQWIGTDNSAAEAAWWPAAWLADGLAWRPTEGLAFFIASISVLLVLGGIYFPHRFFRLLQRLSDGAQQNDTKARTGRNLMWPEQMIARTPAARAAYGFSLSAFRDDRLVRGRLWPAATLPIGFAFFGWWMGGLGDLLVFGPENVLLYGETRLHLSMVVILMFCGQTLVQTLQFSDHSEAAWLFDALPGATPRVMQVGAQQALAYRVLLPLHLVLLLFLMWSMPVMHAVLHVGYWFAVTSLATRVQCLLSSRPPFSRRSDRFSASERFMPLFVSIPVAMAVLIVQTITFQTPLLAAQIVVGLLMLNAAIGSWATNVREGDDIPATDVDQVPVPVVANVSR